MLKQTNGSASYQYDGDITLAELGALVDSFVHGHGVPVDAVITDVRFNAHSYREPVPGSGETFPDYQTVKSTSVTVSWRIEDF